MNSATIPEPLFIAMSIWQLLALPLCIAAHLWMLHAWVRHLQRRTHLADLDLERSPLLDRPITPRRKVWIWNPKTQVHQFEATHLDPP